MTRVIVISRLLKILTWLLLGSALLVALVIAGSFVNHRVATLREEAAHRRRARW